MPEVVQDEGGLLVRRPGSDRYEPVQVAGEWEGGRLVITIRPPPGLVVSEHGAGGGGEGPMRVIFEELDDGTLAHVPRRAHYPACARMSHDRKD